MKPSELQQKTQTELESMAQELRARRLRMRFDLAEKKLKNVSEVGRVRRDLARVLTKLRELHATKLTG